jgi:alkylhydroperoxidase/carboxymuconolactone decarboxylase family protein YurZ
MSPRGAPPEALVDALRMLANGVVPPRRDVRPAGVGPRLDDRSRALAGLGALLATGGSAGAYERRVAEALAAGVSAEEIVDILIEIAPTLGLARLVPGAVELALALGYDIDRALEEHEEG